MVLVPFPGGPKSQDLSDTERHLLLHTWNNTKAAYPRDKFLSELFAETAANHPDSLALAWRDQRLTYRELATKAGKLASHLVTLGVGPEVRVGICMSRCPDMIIAMLAVLHAGGAYVPIDPNYPVERLTFIMEDASAPLLISQSKWSHLVDQTDAKILCLDTGWDFEDATIASWPQTTPDQTAYVLFTSGSTGRPKGVQIGQRSVVAMLSWAAAEFSPAQRQAILAATSICFDLSVFEIFLPLTHGTTVVLADNALDLVNVTHPVSLINTVPSAITELSRANQIPASVTTINLAGEPLRGDLVERLYHQETVEAVYNLYGPSEDTTYSTWAKIPKSGDPHPAIGAPLANSQAYVLNAMGEIIKPGVEGELFMGGDGLARGYLDQPAMTAARFLPNPFSGIPGARMYKTGDLVRYRPNGLLDFLGRLDHQVKIRGFRIELGEIESRLRRHDAIIDAVVVAIRHGGDPQLAAYVARTGSEENDVAFRRELRDYLGEHLPAYMVPAFIIPMDILPQTPNGKVDRKALPEPGQGDTGRSIAKPRSHQEHQLADIWKEALGYDEIGIFEDFFDLGGDSIRALRIVTQARLAGLPFKTIDLFRNRTIAALAEKLPQGEVESTEAAGAKLDVPSSLEITSEIQAKFPNAQAVWPTTAMQESMLFQSRLSGDPTDYLDIFHFTLEGNFDEKRFQKVWQLLTQRHFALRTVFHHHNETVFQVVLSHHQADVQCLTPDQFPTADPNLESFIARELEKGLFPTETPPWRVYLLRESEQRVHFLFLFHHVILDGWSLSVLFKECGQMQTADNPETLLQPTIGYHRFLNWYKNWDMDSGKKYWSERMDGFTEINNILPLPKPDGNVVRRLEIKCLTPEASERIRQFANKHGLTLNTIMQGIWALVTSRYCRSNDIVFGNSTSGRAADVPGIESIVGLVLQTVVSRIQTQSDDTLIPWLHQLQKDHHQAEQQCYYPLVDLQKRLGTTNQKPLFETMVAYENYAGGDWPQGEWAGANLVSIQEREDIHYGLFLQVLPEPVITLKLHSDQRRFEKGGSSRLLSQVYHVLESLPSLENCRPQDIEIMPPEQLETLSSLRQIEAPAYQPRTIVSEFEKQALKTPEATAVVCGNQHLSYEALNRSADFIAYHLLERGLKLEEPVGICLKRNHLLIAAYFGILKAGGIILPIDPNYPEERKAILANDSGIRFLIGTANVWPASAPALEILSPELANVPHAPLPKPKVAPEQLAYIIYTSGSTGIPKGASIPHSAYVNQAEGCVPLLKMSSADRVLQFSSHSFDLSTNEIFKTLMIGATLVVEPHRHGLPPDVLHKLSHRQHLTVLMLPTGFWRTFCEQLSQNQLRLKPHVRLMVAGGERVVPQNLQNWSQVVAPESVFGNCYGPTECTVTTTWRLFKASDVIRQLPKEVPIGTSLPRYQVHLAAPGGPTPQGAPGELFIGGPGLARGYFHNPRLTATVFVPNPVSSEPGGRLYKTGDLIRFGENDELMFVDRIDRQVKIRGFRIELGEIEHHLRQHEQVENAFVISQDDPLGGHRMAAYVVVKKPFQNSLTAKTLHAYLDGRMPHFMLPGAYALMPEFPLTLNGKLNKAALPEPKPIKDPNQARIAPQNETQRKIAEIWCEVLGLKSVGVGDNFFDMGGHSLSALAVHQKIQRAFECSLPLVKIFEHPNIASLAAYMDQAADAPAEKTQNEANEQRLASRRQALRNRRRR